ncbi:MAG: DUF2878 domain-containing protein [Gammaproteobacteria bacterium]|nr:MAG: DUF2878 domain-containing protein [Gammaproteobacteria bacterium]
MKITVVNFLLFQVGWLACVLSGAAGQPWIGTLIAAGIIGWHLWCATSVENEIKLIGAAVMIGVLWDSLLVWQGWLTYPSGMVLPYAAPYWIVVMWALFATTLNVSLRWLKGRWIIAIVFGAIGGPLAYYAGQRLGAVEFIQPEYALFALLIGWGVLTPLLMFMSQHLDGYAEPRVST